MAEIAFSVGSPPEWRIDNGKFAVAMRTTEDDGTVAEDSFHYSVPADFRTHPDCVAAALAALCGGKYQRVTLDFAISEQARAAIQRMGIKELVTPSTSATPRQPGSRTALCFSGGFDSMAAFLLAEGEGVRLVSSDFGGRFKRETEYFRQFDTLVIETDLRQLGFERHAWRFMASPALLYADYLKLGTIGFGTIFEASPYNFSRAGAGTPSGDDGIFGAAGTQYVSWIRGLTELGTAMVMLAYRPDDVLNSIDSLASMGSEKRHRKQRLIQFAAELLGVQDPLDGRVDPPKDRYKFGTAYTVDLLTPLFVARLGYDTVAGFTDNLPPSSAFNDLLSAGVDLYQKFNPNFLRQIPKHLRATVLERMGRAGLEPFNELDFESYAKLRDFLTPFHTIPK